MTADSTLQSLRGVLLEQRRGWETRPLTREVYAAYFRLIESHLSPVGGLNIEVGAGRGSFRGHRSNFLGFDIIPCPWLDLAADACALPFKSTSVANLVAVDVFHHLARPVEFLAEAQRVLVPGGRVLLLEPNVTLFNRWVWRLGSDEGMDFTADPFAEASRAAAPAEEKRNPFAANMALSRLCFWIHRRRFKTLFPDLRVRKRFCLDTLVMPLSGGLTQPIRLKPEWVPWLRALERLATPLNGWFGFRCFVCLEEVLADQAQTA